MSLEAQYRAIYKLVYKRGTRDAYQQGKFKRFEGTTEAEAEQLKVLGGLRLDVVVRLHAEDIGNNWYRPRFPATWTALQVALGADQSELTRRFTDSDAFEMRVDDDRDGRALAAFVNQLSADDAFDNGVWLPELLRYERMINGIWPDDTNPRVETFEWDVGGISESLLRKHLFPIDERPAPLDLLLYRDAAGVTEVALLPDQARVMRKLIAGESVSGEPPALVAKCRRGLRQIRE